MMNYYIYADCTHEKISIKWIPVNFRVTLVTLQFDYQSKVIKITNKIIKNLNNLFNNRWANIYIKSWFVAKRSLIPQNKTYKLITGLIEKNYIE